MESNETNSGEQPEQPGFCNLCGESIPENTTIIEYERSSGEIATINECPTCEEPVRPRPSRPGDDQSKSSSS
jgi:hypothetical protein